MATKTNALLLIGAAVSLGNLILFLIRDSYPSPIATSIVITALGGALFCLVLRIPD